MSKSTPSLDRRNFLRSSLLTAAAGPLVLPNAFQNPAGDVDPKAESPGIVDTNVHLFDWPFRRLKYRQTSALLAKLRKHRVMQAWAGNFEVVLHKNLDAANARLAEECRARGEGLLVPFGSVNPVWPDWEEDLRRCHENHRMAGIRLYPNYHNYQLDNPEFRRLVGLATERGMLIQIAIVMEDERVHHPITKTPPVDAAPLVDILKQLPQARVQLLNGMTALQRGPGPALVRETSVAFDIANLEAVGAVGRVIDGRHWSIKTPIPQTRLLFGSHTPYFPCEAGLLRLFESPLERETLLAIMQGNARRLLESA